MNMIALAGQLDALTQEVADFQRRSKHEDCSDVMTEPKAVELFTRGHAAVQRLAGKGSSYFERAEEIRKEKSYEQMKVLRLTGVLQSLSADIKAGYLTTVEELIHGELFADFLEMASHLVDSGYKDAGAVTAGSALEAHLRQLAKKFNVQVENAGAPKKADQINSELAKAGAYGVLDQKNITAWLDLRNKAAHGKYAEYKKEQVTLLIDGIRNFIARCQACERPGR